MGECKPVTCVWCCLGGLRSEVTHVLYCCLIHACDSNTQGSSDVHMNYVPMATEAPPASKPEASNYYVTDTPDSSSHNGPSPDPQPERRYSNTSEDSEQTLMMSLNSFTAYQSLVRLCPTTYYIILHTISQAACAVKHEVRLFM